MKKQAISLALVLAMLVTTVLVAVPASAVNTTHTAHCACNDKAVGVGSHTECTVPETWTALTDANWADIANGGNFYLADNITAASRIDIEDGKAVTICLNGNTITTGNNKLFVVSNGTLNITDCKGTGAINSAHKQTSGTGARGSIFNTQSTTGEINIFGGTFTANQDAGQTGAGAVAYVKSGTLNIYNGTLNGTSASMGGVMNVAGEAGAVGTINMYGGIVQGGKCNDRGGNVFINSYGAMNMYGGIVQGGECTSTTAAKGGGNFFVSGAYTGIKAGKLYVYGGSILNGDCPRGSNILVYHYGEAHLYGGAVMGGSAEQNSIETLVSGSTVGIFELCGGLVQLTKDTDMTANATKFIVDSTSQDATESLVIDLNGKKLSGDKAAITGKIGLADSSIGKDEIASKSVVANVNIDGFGLADIDQGAYSPVGRYVTLENEGVLSIHRIYVGFETLSLEKKDDGSIGMGYTTAFKADAAVKNALASGSEVFGIKIGMNDDKGTANDASDDDYIVGNDLPKTFGYAADAFVAGGTGNKVTLRVNKILSSEGTSGVTMDVRAQSFVKLSIGGNDVTITSKPYVCSLQDVIDGLYDPANQEMVNQNPAIADLLKHIKDTYGIVATPAPTPAV